MMKLCWRRILKTMYLGMLFVQFPKPFIEVLFRSNPHTHWQCVDKQPDHTLDAVEASGTAGEGGSKQDIVFAAPLTQEQRPSPLNQGLQSHPCPLCQFTQVGDEGAGHAHLIRNERRRNQGDVQGGAWQGRRRTKACKA